MEKIKPKLKFMISERISYIKFAFYPKISIILTLLCTAILDSILIIINYNVPADATLDDVIFAIITGVTASAIVSIVIEISNNFKQNLLAWHELSEFYSAIYNYNNMHYIYTNKAPTEIAHDKARADFIEQGGIIEEDEEDCTAEDMDTHCDEVQATWRLVPSTVPILLKALENKKAYLTNKEIFILEIISVNFKYIRDIVKDVISHKLMHNTVNHPDEKYLNNLFPKNILEDIPEWVLKHIASNESYDAIERIVDIVLSDHFLLEQLFKDYDISIQSAEKYGDKSNNADDSSLISDCCLTIHDEIQNLLKILKKKPYYKQVMKTNKKFQKNPLKSDVAKIFYENEMDRLKKAKN